MSASAGDKSRPTLTLPRFAHELESFVSVSRQMETALAQEREIVVALKSRMEAMERELRGKLAETEGRVKASTDQSQLLAAQLRDSNDKLQDAEARLAAESQRRADADAKATKTVAAHDRLRAEADSLRKALAEHRDYATKVVERFRTMTAAYQKMKIEARQANEERAKLAVRLQEAEAQGRTSGLENERYKGKIGELEARNRALEERLAAERESRERIENQLRAQAVEANAVRVRLREVEDRLRDANAHANTLAIKLQQPAIDPELVKRQEAEIQRLTEALRQSRKETDEVRRERDNAIGNLRSKLAEAESANRRLEGRLNEMQGYLTELQQAAAKMRAELDSKTQLHDRIDELEKVARDARSEKSRMMRNESVLKAEIERLRNAYPLRELLKKKESELEAAESRVKVTPTTAPEHKKQKEALDFLREQRDQLRDMVRESDRRLEAQLKRIRQEAP